MIRYTLIATDGSQVTGTTDQDGWDALVDEHDALGTAYPKGSAERQLKSSGKWVFSGGWDHSPRVREVAPIVRVDYNAENLALAALHDAQDRRENRRSYYLRTGR